MSENKLPPLAAQAGVKVKTSELIGPALNWAVEEAQGYGSRYIEFWNMGGDKRFVYCQVGHSPSTDWAQGGPIIEREKIETYWHRAMGTWAACHDGNLRYGHTLLVAAMRCFVSSKLGDTVDIPEELV